MESKAGSYWMYNVTELLEDKYWSHHVTHLYLSQHLDTNHHKFLSLLFCP